MCDQNIAFYAKQSFFNLKGSKITKNGVCVLFQIGSCQFIYHAEYIFQGNDTFVWVGSFEIVMSIN